MRDALDAFLASVPDSGAMLIKHSDAVAIFGFFLSEIQHKTITPVAVSECYGAARINAPKNMSDTMGKSGAFVREKGQWILQRDTVLKFKAVTPTFTSNAQQATDGRKTSVMVVYGRDEDTRIDLFAFLRSLDLVPIEWNSAVARTGKASPYIGEIVTTAFSMAQAFLVLMTPDERAGLRAELCQRPNDEDLGYQPRPNVILEAGMALATDEARTVLVTAGPLRGMSDLDGRHVIRLSNAIERRNDLVQRLRVAGCDPKRTTPTGCVSETLSGGSVSISLDSLLRLSSGEYEG